MNYIKENKAIRISSGKQVTLKRILFAAGIALILGHAVFLTGYNILVPLFMILPMLPLAYFLLIKRDFFSFILVLFICSHFSYSNDLGGIWNLMAFLLFLGYLLFNKKTLWVKSKNKKANLFLSILLFSNFLGWILVNKIELIYRFFGIINFFSFIIIFIIVSSFTLTRERIRKWLYCSGFIAIWIFLVSLNQKIALINMQTPLLGVDPKSAINPISAGFRLGLFGHSELNGEYGMLLFVLFFPFMISILNSRGFSLNRKIVLAFSLSAFLTAILSSARSAVLLIVLGIIVIFLGYVFRIFKEKLQFQTIFFSGVLILFGILVFSEKLKFFGADELSQKYQKGFEQKFTLSGILSGENINRSTTTNEGIARLSSRFWLIGYGYGVPISNTMALYNLSQDALSNSKVGYADFHNLYLELPIIYGFVGGLAFLGLLIYLLLRLYQLSRQSDYQPPFFHNLSYILMVFWICFLFDQYKISMFRIPSYHMVIWFWLGFSYAVVNTADHFRRNRANLSAAIQ